jgi:hypothetical protein
MRDKIWYEMTHIKYGDTYLAYYLFRQKTIKKWFKILTLVFSASGVLGWKFWDGFPVIACILISVLQLFNLVENQIIISEKESEKISNLRNKYVSYFNSLEKLWIDFDADRLNEQEATEQFYQLRQVGLEIEALDNELHIRKIKKLCQKADLETRDYIIQYHS